MLQKIRDNTQGAISKFIIYFIIAIFSLWGVDTIVGTFVAGSNSVDVDGTEITSAEIEALTQQKAQEYLTSLGPDADFSGYDENQFREQALNELIQRELLRQSAEASGMAVSSTAIDRRIAQTTDFQVDGVFNAERATLVLQSMGYSPAGYRALLARETLLNHQLAAYSATGFATQADIERVAAISHQKRTFRYLTLTLDTEGAQIDISEDDIAAYYAENESEFMREEQVRLTYLELDKESMFDEVTVDEADIRAAYDAEIAAFAAQVERRASHILFEAGSEEEFAAAAQAATQAKARLDAGEDFAALAMELSDDTGSAQDGGDVGYTTGDNFDEAFEAALRDLEPGQVSGPVRTDFGVHLIKLTEQSESEVPTFEARQAEIERNLKSAQVEALFLERAEELGNLAFESLDLAEPARQLGLPIQNTDLFGRSGGSGIAANPAVIEAAFSTPALEERLNSDLIPLDGDRSVVIHVDDHQAPELRPLDEVRGEIEVLLRIERMQEQTRTLGESIVRSLESGDNIDALLEVQNLSWTEASDVERGAPGINPELLDRVFTASAPAEGETVVQGFQGINGDYLVFELQSVVDGTVDDFREGELDSLRNFISQQSAANDFAGFMLGLESRADITGKQAYLVLPEEEFE